jgi:hypothetical protein
LGCAVGLLVQFDEDHGRTSEGVPPGEEQAINTIVALALGELQKRYRPALRWSGAMRTPRRTVALRRYSRRQSYRKSPLRTFSTPGREFRAWVRYSNGAFEPGADRHGRSRHGGENPGASITRLKLTARTGRRARSAYHTTS